ncbi:MAG: hypothetical protein IJG68_05995 [Bacilli bacterium]|nr:hypothetical protein [Bacilli bacterium]
MIKIYKKINKTMNNLYGSCEIKNINDLNKPFLLCISDSDSFDKAIFGIIREGAHAARVYTTQENAAGFKIEKMPIDFLGIKRIENEEKIENELSKDFLLPFLKLHGLNKNSIMKQARKINLFTFGDGCITYKNSEKELFSGLCNEGFSKKEAEEILSQISLTALGTKEELSDLYATNIRFIDLCNIKTQNEKLREYGNILMRNKTLSMYCPIGKKNSYDYLFLGQGKYSAKDYLKDECPAKAAISAVVSFFLQNSLDNLKSNNLVRINRDVFTEPLYQYGANLKPLKETLSNLDSKIKYDDTPKYTKEEFSLRAELDTACKAIQKKQLLVKNREEENHELTEKVNTIITNIKKYSSETTYYQILIRSNLWHTNEEFLEEESDKEFRKKAIKKEKENKKSTKSGKTKTTKKSN